MRISTLWLCMGVATIGVAAIVPRTAVAQQADLQAEKYRLTEEMKRLAQRNAWPGVESKYEELVALGVDIDFETHRLGAESAKYLGKTYEVYQRLERAVAVQDDAEIRAEMEQLDAKYGRVKLVGSERWEVTLRRPAMPFAPDERKSVEYGIMVAQESGGFTGMLPLGDYIIGAEGGKAELPFTVTAGPTFQQITITRDLVSSSEGLIVYHGPIALAGYAFTTTPAPKEAVCNDGTGGVGACEGQGVMKAEPDTHSGSGITAEVGYEIGFTRLFAIAATFEYRNLLGGEDQFHGYSGTFYGLLRPGNLRIGLGGTYGRWGGQGLGVYEVFDVGQDTATYPLDTTKYDGESWAGGAKLSVGYGVLDLEPLNGFIELQGFWQTDGVRSYMGGGLRVGIVPQVPRFRE